MSDDFSDLIADAPEAAPAVSPGTPPVAAVTPAELSAQLHALVESGASADAIHAYIAAHGYTNPQGVEEAVAYHAKGGKGVNVLVNGQPANPGAATPEDFSDLIAPAAAPAPDESVGRSLGLGTREVMRGGAQMLGIVGNPLNTAVNAVTGADLPMVSGAGDQLADAIGLPKEATDAERLAGAGVSGMTGALLPVAGAAGVAGALPEALTAAPIAQAVGGASGGMASEDARQSGAGTFGQVAAGLAGGVAGAGAVSGVAGLAQRAPAVASPVMQAFDRQSVPAMAADVGGTLSKQGTAYANMTLGGVPLQAAAKRTLAAVAASRDRIAGKIGIVKDMTGAGQSAQAGARTFIADSGDKATNLYNAIPIAPTRAATLTNTKNALDDLTGGLRSNLELSATTADARLQSYADALKKGGLSWEDLKAFRSYIGEKAGAQSLQSDTSKKSLQTLYGALSDDMRATAAADGPKSLAAFQRANSYYRARQARIDNVLTPLLGKDLSKGPEAAFAQIQSWSSSRGDVAKLAQALRSMPEEEAGTVRASIFDRLGNANPGGQNAAGDVFSPATFVTHWNKMSDRAKSALFPGADYRQDIHDLANIADSVKGASKYANTSHTGLVVNASAHSVGLFANPLATVASMVGEYGIGSLLASPRFARWLASSATKPNPAAQLAHINRLTAIAAAEPGIATPLLHLQERLATPFANDNFTPSAVADPDQMHKRARQ